MHHSKSFQLVITLSLLFSALGARSVVHAAQTAAATATAVPSPKLHPTISITLPPDALTVAAPTLAPPPLPTIVSTSTSESLTSAPVTWLAVVTAVLVALGGFLIWQRRQSER